MERKREDRCQYYRLIGCTQKWSTVLSAAVYTLLLRDVPGVVIAQEAPERLSLWPDWHHGSLLSFPGGWVYTHCRADLAFLPGSPEFP